MLPLLTQALHRFPRAFIWVATILGVSAMLLVFSAVIVDSRNTAWRFNEQSLQNIAVLAELDISRNIEMFDLSLQAVRDGVGDAGIMALEPKIRNQVLFDRSTTAKGIGLILVLDANGRLLLDSKGSSSRSSDLSDRNYFKVHRDSPVDVGLYVSRPFRSRLSGQWSIGFSRRISRPDGSFLGVAMGAVRLGYIATLFDHIDLGRDGSISLLRDDGTLVVGNTGPLEAAGSDWHTDPVFEKIRSADSGLFVGTRAEDGIERLYAYRRLANLPLVIDVGRATWPIEEPWWRKTLILASVLLIMSAAVLCLVKLLDKELVRRIRAEQRSAVLARTDGLTGLANRRMFDEALQREWADARRDRTPLTLLMFDSDWFKVFNDLYGHQAGDSALVGIAGIIAKSIRRSGDLAARYGGEEFVVLLPGTELGDAAVLAHAIRLGIYALDVVNPGSPFGRVTVSCGVASLIPGPDADATILVRAADAALYRAKQAGRHGVAVSDPSGVAAVDAAA